MSKAFEDESSFQDTRMVSLVPMIEKRKRVYSSSEAARQEKFIASFSSLPRAFKEVSKWVIEVLIASRIFSLFIYLPTVGRHHWFLGQNSYKILFYTEFLGVWLKTEIAVVPQKVLIESIERLVKGK